MSAMNEAAPDLVGRVVLGRYRIVRSIGRGGMGVIYLARSEGAARFVKPFVIKQAAPDDALDGESLHALLAREARIMSHLNHPGIVNVIDFAEEAGSYLLVLDYVHGFNLGQWARFFQYRSRPVPVPMVLYAARRVLEALDYAHTLVGADGEPLDIVHRDISPANVLIDTDGNVKLADFGVARMREDRTETTDGQKIKGKFSYMAPELLGDGEPSPSSDVYACAVMIHELLVGKNEFRADNVSQTIVRVMNHVPSRVSDTRRDVPVDLDVVLARAMAKSKADRYQSARELAEALARVRRQAPEVAARDFARAVKEDFNDPRMSDLLGVDDPSSLERAWRTSPEEPSLGSGGSGPISQRGAAAISVSGLKRRTDSIPILLEDGRSPSSSPRVEAPTLLDHRAVSYPPPPLPRLDLPPPSYAPPPPSVASASPPASMKHRSHPLLVAFGVVGVLSGLLGGALWWRAQRAEASSAQDRVIFVDGRVGGAPVSGAVAARPDPAQGAPLAPVVPQPTEAAVASSTPQAAAPNGPAASIAPASAASAPESARAEALTTVLARRQDRIKACFTDHAADITGAPALSVHFDIDTTGRVTAAQVLPAALAATPLGACIASVARATQFGPQPRPLSFRIPLTAHRTP